MVNISLDSASKQHVVIAAPKDAILTVTKTSAPDVYVSAWSDEAGNELLSAGDSMLVKAGTLKAFLFRKSPDGSPYSAALTLVNTA